MIEVNIECKNGTTHNIWLGITIKEFRSLLESVLGEFLVLSNDNEYLSVRCDDIQAVNAKVCIEPSGE